MITIHKAVLKVADIQEIEVPQGAALIHAREQQDTVCVWYRCNTEAPKEKRKISVVGTGRPVPIDGRYVGTAALYGASLILHVFETPPSAS